MPKKDFKLETLLFFYSSPYCVQVILEFQQNIVELVLFRDSSECQLIFELQACDVFGSQLIVEFQLIAEP